MLSGPASNASIEKNEFQRHQKKSCTYSAYICTYPDPDRPRASGPRSGLPPLRIPESVRAWLLHQRDPGFTAPVAVCTSPARRIHFCLRVADLFAFIIEIPVSVAYLAQIIYGDRCPLPSRRSARRRRPVPFRWVPVGPLVKVTSRGSVSRWLPRWHLLPTTTAAT